MRGEYFILGSALIEGLFPIVINAGTKSFPPILFGALSVLLSAMLFLIIRIRQGSFFSIFRRKALAPLCGVTLFVILIPYPLIYIGSSMSTGINTAILLQTEILFTFIFFTLFFGERASVQKILGALLVLFGAASILFQDEFSFHNPGNFLILLAAVFPPFGNYFAKKALRILKPVDVLFFRYLLGGIFLLSFSFLFEDSYSFASLSQSDMLFLIPLNAFLTLSVGKLFWYQGLRTVSVTRAISILFSYPAFSLVYAMIFLREIPTSFQIIGFLFIMAGLLLLTQKMSFKKFIVEG